MPRGDSADAAGAFFAAASARAAPPPATRKQPWRTRQRQTAPAWTRLPGPANHGTMAKEGARSWDVGTWLRGLGLGQYEAAFRENEIDETVLASLTHETLKEIGVTPVGHRLKLLDAIAALRTDTSARAPSADATSTSAAPSIRTEDRAERRQVTVMFSDLVSIKLARL